jgi:hypothetical protein
MGKGGGISEFRAKVGGIMRSIKLLGVLSSPYNICMVAESFIKMNYTGLEIAARCSVTAPPAYCVDGMNGTSR